MAFGIATIEPLSLESDIVPEYAVGRNRARNRKSLVGLLMISLVTVFVGVPAFLYISLPFTQLVQPLTSGRAINAVSSVHSGQFLWFVISHWGQFPGFYDWVNWLVGMGLSYALSVAIAAALLKAGWISAATFIAVVGGITGGVGAIVLAGAAAAF